MIRWASSGWFEDPQQQGREPEFSGAYPFALVKRGFNEWKRTGVIPDPLAIAARDPRWEQDLYALDDLVERSRPNDTNPQPPGPPS